MMELPKRHATSLYGQPVSLNSRVLLLSTRGVTHPLLLQSSGRQPTPEHGVSDSPLHGSESAASLSRVASLISGEVAVRPTLPVRGSLLLVW